MTKNCPDCGNELEEMKSEHVASFYFCETCKNIVLTKDIVETDIPHGANHDVDR